MVSDVYNTGKGYAFVTFDRKEDADTAMDAMDGQTILGQQIKVKILFSCVMVEGYLSEIVVSFIGIYLSFKWVDLLY